MAKKMTQIPHIVTISLLLILSSCAKLYFLTPQPRNGITLKRIPTDMTGIYSDSTFTIKLTPDSLYVSGFGFRLTGKYPGKGEVLLKYDHPFYFAVIRDSLYYEIYMGQFIDTKLAVYMLNGDPHSINLLRRVVKVETLNPEKGHYLINPAGKEFEAMLEWDIWDVVGVFPKKLTNTK